MAEATGPGAQLRRCKREVRKGKTLSGNRRKSKRSPFLPVMDPAEIAWIGSGKELFPAGKATSDRVPQLYLERPVPAFPCQSVFLASTLEFVVRSCGWSRCCCQLKAKVGKALACSITRAKK